MRTRGDKRPSRKNDRKVLVAEESNKSCADTDSDSTSSSSSSSDSEQEEVHCLMADQTSDEESSLVLLLTDSSSVFANEDDQMDMDHRSDSPDLSHDSSMHFVEDDIHLFIQRSRQEAQNDNNALSLALKAVRTQNAILSIDLAATQKEVKDLQVALSKDFDDKLADIRNGLLEFRVETQGKLASLGTHLAELIAFLTKGSDDKKGEDSSSRRPQPPPDDQNRPGSGSGSRTDDQSIYDGVSVSRDVGTRGSGSEIRRRGDKSGSKRKQSSGGGESPVRGIFYGPYLPPKPDAEYWITGKKQF
ncbi:hypothetical protein F511_37494 [Dorcoceras hygrometricum]|uniref:Uncharacterized protein n=1 Tax=Dorcoceras hygrometricum TaxID=472368 RepID=A0A2Z7AHN0_9LAMI|nr:hypothetical protein F511_37494 [Dorcoceras hygrometricum]